jgi:hypothetical protein
MSDLIDPLTPPECDLRGFGYMPLEVVRLRDSGLAMEADGDEFRAAVLLWCASWHQIPAGSLPKNESALAILAGYGRDTKGWRRVADGALRGYQEAKDGRLYHPVICAIALESWRKKRIQSGRTEAASKARWMRNGIRDVMRNGIRDGERNGGSTESVTESKGREGKGIEGSPPNPQGGIAWEEGLFQEIRRVGKMPDLQLAHLVQWFRSVPAEAKTAEAAAGIVMELEAWTGKVTSPAGWLARRIQALEPLAKIENENRAPVAAEVRVGPPVEAM